jgi:hypothetical protein
MADSLPPEVLARIFTIVHNELCISREEHALYGQFEWPNFPVGWIHFASAGQIGNLRLVSRRWKPIADTLFFGDMRIPVDLPPKIDRVSGPYGMEHSDLEILDTVFHEGYVNLVRTVNLHLMGCNDSEIEILGFEFTPFCAYIDSICDLLTNYSCRYLRISIFPSSEHWKRKGIQYMLLKKITDACQKLPRQCDLEFWTRSPNCGAIQTSYEEWFTTKAPDTVAVKLSTLGIKDCWYISNTFFASLHHTKKLHLWTADGFYHDFEELASGINIMPVLEVLSTDVPLSQIPKTLRRLHLGVIHHSFLEPDLVSQLFQNHRLQDLRLSFSPRSLQVPDYPLAPQLSQIGEPQCPNLRVLHISTDIDSRTIQLLCSNILRVSPSLEDIKLSGMCITNEMILDTVTRSLRNVSLDIPSWHAEHEIETGMDQAPEKISLDTLRNLFQKNPGIS